MRKFLLIIMVAIIPLSISAKKYIPSKDVFLSFFNSHTYVVLPNNPFSEYNTTIEKAIKDNWTITDYSFIKETEFEKYRKDPKNSFIIVTHDKFENDKMPASYDFINIMIGKNVNDIDQMPYVFSFPLKYTNSENELYVPFMNTLVLFMQNHLNKVKENPDKLLKADMFKPYNKEKSQIKSGMLYFPLEYMSTEVNSIEKIDSLYNHKHSVINNSDINKIMAGEQIFIIYKVGPEECKLKSKVFKYIFDNKGNMYFAAKHNYSQKAGDGFLIKDIKRINK